jgi:23S rRNA (uracil1939-C5)-methyltransferase
MSKIKKNFILENLEVVDISTEGKAIAKHDGLVVFIEGAVPGDVVDVMVHRKKNSFAEGKVHQFITLSKDRTEPKCEHFGTCGGCKWQNLSYETQLKFKQKYVFDAFTRIGKFEFAELLPILGNNEAYFYRNKLEFSFSNKKWLTAEQMAVTRRCAKDERARFMYNGETMLSNDFFTVYYNKEVVNLFRFKTNLI